MESRTIHPDPTFTSPNDKVASNPLRQKSCVLTKEKFSMDRRHTEEREEKRSRYGWGRITKTSASTDVHSIRKHRLKKIASIKKEKTTENSKANIIKIQNSNDSPRQVSLLWYEKNKTGSD